jgi:hypothetical protein
MTAPKSVTMLVTYTPKPGSESELLRLVKKHWPTLRQLGLVTSTPGRVWRGTDKRSGRASFVEIFDWADDSASETAHQTPEVMAIWETMGPLLEGMTLTRLESA